MVKTLLNHLGEILGVIGILITILIYFINKEKKKLSYEFLAISPLLTQKEVGDEKIKVLYENQEVKNVTFIEIKLMNNGNKSILEEDFKTPIRFEFTNNITLLSTDIIKKSPTDIHPEIILKPNSNLNLIELNPLLLNVKDLIVFKFIISHKGVNNTRLRNSIKINGRINGVKKIQEFDKMNSESYIFKSSILMSIVMGGIAYFAIYYIDKNRDFNLLELFISILITYLVMVFTSWIIAVYFRLLSKIFYQISSSKLN